MAGKKQHRSSTIAGKKLTAEELGAAAAGSATRRIISLAGGTWCYLQTADGKMHHLKVDSDRMQQTLQEVGATSPALLERLLTEMGALNGDFPAAVSRHVRDSSGDATDQAA